VICCVVAAWMLLTTPCFSTHRRNHGKAALAKPTTMLFLVVATVLAVWQGASHSAIRATLFCGNAALHTDFRASRRGCASSTPMSLHATSIQHAWNQWVMRWFILDHRHGTQRVPATRVDDDLGKDLSRIWHLAKNEARLLYVGVVFLLIAAGIRVLIPQAIAKTLVVAISQSNTPPAKKVLMSSARHLAILSLGYGVASGARGLVMSIMENRLLMRLRRQTLARLLQQDIAFHDERSVGELTSRLNSDCEAVSSGLSMNFNILLRNMVTMFFGVCYLTYTSWRLSTMLFGIWAMLFFVYTRYGRFTRNASLIRQDALADLNSVATEGLQKIRTVRALGCEDDVLHNYRGAATRLIFIEHQRAAAYGLYATFYNGLTQGIKAVALGAGGILVARGMLNPEQLTAAMLYVDSVVGSSLAVGGQYRQLMQSIGSSRRVFEYAEMPPSLSVLSDCREDHGHQARLNAIHGGVLFRNVHFNYPSRPDETVLNGLNLELVAGSITALVGSSGSGKSTVACLLQRWYEPDAGEVFIDGVNIRELDPGWMRSLFGVVTQDPGLFSASVWDNLVIGLSEHSDSIGFAEGCLLDGRPLRPVLADSRNAGSTRAEEATRKVVYEAAKTACAHDFIQELPNGYDTIVGDVRLSGGQRQRLALARALARQPKFLVLDEATSALDRKTEASVQASLRTYLRKHGATCLVIAHRLSTVEDADRIVVMDQGRIAEDGTHQSLLQQPGLYSRLVQASV